MEKMQLSKWEVVLGATNRVTHPPLLINSKMTYCYVAINSNNVVEYNNNIYIHHFLLNIVSIIFSVYFKYWTVMVYIGSLNISKMIL